VSIALKLRTYGALGLTNLARVGAYRLGLRLGVHPVQRLNSAPVSGPFFRAAPQPGDLPSVDDGWLTSVIRFDWHEEPMPPGNIPDWFANPFGAHGGAQADQPWWTIDDFGGGDIKGLWELSRFGWVCALAGCAAKGKAGAGERLNAWLADWAMRNPPYLGPNWKCGQEASIRVMHLAAAAVALAEDAEPLPGLTALIAQHLARIAPTMSYALGQDNNHGTSEAAALFIGGSWLSAAGDARGAAWAATGRRWLEERAQHLIMADGSFSQYSVTYHRVMLDSYALAELWRARRGLPAFTAALMGRLRAATYWLYAMVDPETGDAPNSGASDGARLLPFAATGYRDFRPSVQLAAALFQGQRTYPITVADGLARWLGVTVPDTPAVPLASASFADGGWQVLRTGRAMALLRVPNYRFRPSHADALHVDLSVHGMNLLRDAGTYSYNDPAMPDGDFAGTAFHNTISFDGADQMPRLSRFLYGGWLSAEDVEPVQETPDGITSAAAYRDARGNRHHRRVTLSSRQLRVEDQISGLFAQATLHWNLPFGDWRMDGDALIGPQLRLCAMVDDQPCRFALHQAREARHYGRMEPLQAASLVVDRPCTIMTIAEF
jgi:hypothetical protein